MTLAHPAFLVVVVAAVFIVYGRLTKRLPVAVIGFVLLALAAILALLTR